MLFNLCLEGTRITCFSTVFGDSCGSTTTTIHINNYCKVIGLVYTHLTNLRWWWISRSSHGVWCLVVSKSSNILLFLHNDCQQLYTSKQGICQGMNIIIRIGFQELWPIFVCRVTPKMVAPINVLKLTVILLPNSTTGIFMYTTHLQQFTKPASVLRTPINYMLNL